MAEIMLERRSNLEGRFHASARVRVEPAAPASRMSLRAPQKSVAALSKALGVTLPKKPKTSAAGMGLTALWLGPDEWFVFSDVTINPVGKCAGVKVGHSAVDISQRNQAIIVEGTAAADVLNGGCPQDLSDAAFPVGACSRTVLGKCEIILYRETEDRYRVEVWRSFAPYAFDFLVESAELNT